MIDRADDRKPDELFVQWQQGDVEAGNLLLGRYWNRIVEAAERTLRDVRLGSLHDRSRELLDSVIGDLLPGLSDLEWRGPDAFVSLMVKRIRWKKLDHEYRRATLKRGGPMHGVDPRGGTENLRALVRSPGTGKSPSEVACDAENRRRVAGAVARLEERERRAVEAYYTEGKTLAEIAGEIGLTPSGVKRLLTRVLLALEKELRAG